MAGIITWWVISATHRQDVVTMENQLLAQKIEEIDKFVKETAGLFEIRVGYEQLSVIEKADQEILLEKLLEENKFIIEATFADAIGQETAKRISAGETAETELFNVRELPKFRTAFSGRTYFGPVYYDRNVPMMSVAAPVYNRNGQIIMALCGEISLAPLADMLASARLGRSGYVYLVDGGGLIMAASDKGLAGKDLAASSWIKELLQGKAHSGLEKGDRRTGILNADVLSAGLPVPNLGWGMIAEWPYQDAFSVVSNIQWQVIGFSIITVMVVAFLGWLAGRTILQPLAALRRGAEKIGGGEFDYKIRIATRDEIEELGEVFNQMGSDLKRLEELKLAEARAQALAESLRKEKELSRMKEEFITNTSHQLRTPLSIMNWNLEMLAEAELAAEQKPILGDFQNGLRQLNDIVRDLLFFSEYGPGYKSAVVEKIELPEMIKKIVRARAEIFKKKRLAHEEIIAENTPPLSGNPRALEIVLENLVDNALTYTPAGGRVKIEVRPEDDKVHFAIGDSGIGIPEKDKPSIFTQFFRASNVTAMKNVGTGLGLYLSKNIVEGHGGKIRFESQENKGTTFHILLPAK